MCLFAIGPRPTSTGVRDSVTDSGFTECYLFQSLIKFHSNILVAGAVCVKGCLRSWVFKKRPQLLSSRFQVACKMSEAALILWLLSPILDNTLRYIFLGLLLALLVTYIVDQYIPSRMVLRLENTVKTLRHTLDHAMGNCPRDWAELRELGYQLTQYVAGGHLFNAM
ncbi:hypothetical protein B0H16DRAFT_1646584 [Mycena metata]|uniref:Uncharacterized protein n=1 Tax=Mycena metata TaxID=1033252 RepID=A0AAD7DQZ4_9AGAR|nr:hypothetical protein B0H16DRAFT_1646584 [Mycena metata]